METSNSNVRQKQTVVRLGLIFLIALLLRCMVLAYVGRDVRKLYTSDSKEYLTLAQNLVDHGVYEGDKLPPMTLDLKRTPIYPLFIAATLVTFGENLTATVFVQIILGSVCTTLTFCITKKLGFGTRAGIMAACFVALDPVALLINNRLLSETLFTFGLLLGIWLLISFWQNNRKHYLGISAVVISLTVLTRPIAQFLPLAMLPFFIIIQPFKKLRVRSLDALLFILISGGIIFSWGYRNYQKSDRFLLSTIADTNLVYYRARAVLAKVDEISQGEALAELEQELLYPARQKNLPLSEIISLQRERSMQIFRQYPLQTFEMVVEGAGRLLFDPGFTIICTMLDTSSADYECFKGQSTMLESGKLQKVMQKFLNMTIIQQVFLVWGFIFLGIVYIGVLVGVFHLARAKNWQSLLLICVVIIYFVGLSAGAEANYRMRVPIQPFLAILAAVGYASLYRFVFSRPRLNHNCDTVK